VSLDFWSWSTQREPTHRENIKKYTPHSKAPVNQQVKTCCSHKTPTTTPPWQPQVESTKTRRSMELKQRYYLQCPQKLATFIQIFHFWTWLKTLREKRNVPSYITASSAVGYRPPAQHFNPLIKAKQFIKQTHHPSGSRMQNLFRTLHQRATVGTCCSLSLSRQLVPWQSRCHNKRNTVFSNASRDVQE